MLDTEQIFKFQHNIKLTSYNPTDCFTQLRDQGSSGVSATKIKTMVSDQE